MEYKDCGTESWLYFEVIPNRSPSMWLLGCLLLVAVGTTIALR